MRSTKTVGPVSARLLTEFQRKGRHVFTLSGAQQILKTNYFATAKLLTMMRQRGLIARIKAATYLILQTGSENTQLKNWPILARELAGSDPYFISYYSAMRMHGMTAHPLLEVYLTLPKRRSARKISGITYRFIYSKSEHFWGAAKHWATKQEQIQVSDLERTVLDTLDRPDLCGGFIEVARGIWGKQKEMDQERLSQYAKKFHSKAAIKRLGYILEIFCAGSNHIPALWESTAGTKDYVLLDPHGPKEGKYVSRWRIRLNVPLEELKGSVSG